MRGPRVGGGRPYLLVGELGLKPLALHPLRLGDLIGRHLGGLFTRLAVAEAELRAVKEILADVLDILAEMKANQDEMRQDHRVPQPDLKSDRRGCDLSKSMG